MHDFVAKAIKLMQIDPQDSGKQPPRTPAPAPAPAQPRGRVLVFVAHIVRLVPQYYVESGDGTRMITEADVGDDDDKQSSTTGPQGLKRSFLVLDAAGGQYESHTASSKAQAALEAMWNEAF